MRDILIGAVSSILTAMVIFIGGQFLGIFETKADRAIASDVGQQILEDPVLSRLLISALSENDSFKGRVGDQGIQGVQGIPGPEWKPSLSYYELKTTAAAPGSKERSLGANKFCGLTSVRTHHAKQACGCLLQDTEKGWLMKLTSDDDIDGACYCGATCLN